MANQSTLARCTSLAATLPPEILSMIFNLILSPNSRPTPTSSPAHDQRTKHALMSVCFAWWAATDARDDLVVASSAQLARLAKHLLKDTQHGRRVRVLHVCLSGELESAARPAFLASLARAVRCAPNLEELELRPVGGHLGHAWLDHASLRKAIGQCKLLKVLRVCNAGKCQDDLLPELVGALSKLPQLDTLELAGFQLDPPADRPSYITKPALVPFPARLEHLVLHLAGHGAFWLLFYLLLGLRAPLVSLHVVCAERFGHVRIVANVFRPLLRGGRALVLHDGTPSARPDLLFSLLPPRSAPAAATLALTPADLAAPQLRQLPLGATRIHLCLPDDFDASTVGTAQVRALVLRLETATEVVIEHARGRAPWDAAEREMLVRRPGPEGVVVQFAERLA